MQRAPIYAAKRFRSIGGASLLVVPGFAAHTYGADMLAITQHIRSRLTWRR